MPVLETINKAQAPQAPKPNLVSEDWRFIISDKGRDTVFINYLVAALRPVVGTVYPDTYVRAPGMRFHPIYKKSMPHNGWDVVFIEPREFTLEQLKTALESSFKVQTLETGFNERSGNFITITAIPKFIENASLWVITLCHLQKQGAIWSQGSTGASTGDHVHIGIRVHGQVV